MALWLYGRQGFSGDCGMAEKKVALTGAFRRGHSSSLASVDGCKFRQASVLASVNRRKPEVVLPLLT